MKNFLIIKDLVTFKLTKEDSAKIKDDYAGAFKPLPPGELHHTGMGMIPGGETQKQQPQGQGLFAEIAASHAGIVTSNNKMYLPEKMSEGVSTFTKSYNKPVLLHHNDHKDPVGRIVSAEYVDTSGAIVDKLIGSVIKDSKNNEETSLNSTVLKDFVKGDLPLEMQYKVIDALSKDSFIQDSDSGYTGLGFAKIIANILDRDAIEKIIDGRYLTGSVGLRTDKAVCSVCHQDWVLDSLCEHRPGASYDGAKCFLITGSLFYDEYSFVNSPADKNSQILELHYNDSLEKIEVDQKPDRIHDVRMGLSFKPYSKEQDSVKKTEKETIEIKDGKKEAKKAKKVEDSKSSTKATKTVKVVDTTETNTAVKEEVIKDDKNSEAKTEKETVEKDLPEIKDEINEPEEKRPSSIIDSFELYSVKNEEELYSLVSDSAKELAKKGIFSEEEVSKSLMDSDKRSSLPKSAFCGPERSFPAVDAIHVAAIEAVLVHLSDELDIKKKIVKTLKRKAKVFNYVKDEVTIEVEGDGDSDSNVARELMRAILEVFSTDTERVKVLSPEEITMLQKILSRLSLMAGKDAFELSLAAIGFSTDKKEEELLLDQIEKQEDSMGEMNETVSALRKEYNTLYSDVEKLQDSLVEEKLSIRKVKEDYLNLLTSLKDCSKSSVSLEEVSISDLESRLCDAKKELKLDIILDKLDNGMSRIPTEDVKSPIEDMDSSNEERQFTVSDMKNMEVQYWSLCYSRGIDVAQAYLQNIKQSGMLPTNNS